MQKVELAEHLVMMNFIYSIRDMARAVDVVITDDEWKTIIDIQNRVNAAASIAIPKLMGREQ